tara:strand:+ start:1665 stop:2276 length:612 start_codon:yes stop_codon:yes gene_type:complete
VQLLNLRGLGVVEYSSIGTLTLENATLAAAEGFIRPYTKDLKDDVDNHLRLAKFGFQFHCRGEFLGFTLFQYQEDLLMGAGMQIRPVAQGFGLVKQAILLAKERANAKFLAYKTQNPRMWQVGERLCSAWTPTLEYGFVNKDINAVRNRAAEFYGVKPTVTSGFYGQALYGKKPTHWDGQIQEWWDSVCNFEQGDSVLCVGKF